MLAAERNGKAALFASSEDIVTSTVFGLVRYLPWQLGLGRVLQLLLDGPMPRAPAELFFWPPGEGVEADLVIESPEAVALFEVKLDASFGPQQLGREWAWLCRRVRERPRTLDGETVSGRRVLATITRRALSPGELRRQVVADLKELGSTELPPAPNEVRAVTWLELGDWLLSDPVGFAEPHVSALLEDIEYFLRSRGLRTAPFAGWPAPGRTWSACSTWYEPSYFRGIAGAYTPSRWQLSKASFYGGGSR